MDWKTFFLIKLQSLWLFFYLLMQLVIFDNLDKNAYPADLILFSLSSIIRSNELGDTPTNKEASALLRP